MRVSRIEIQNFRSIRHLVVDLGDTTVFVGPNNAGKTAILDALRIPLTRRWGQRGTGFNEYDIHVSSDGDDPKASPGVSIVIHLQETESEKWPDGITEDLHQIVQLNPKTDLHSIVLRTRYAWSEENDAFESTWEFLNAARDPFAGRSARRTNLERFWRYVPVFYLDALRDACTEFSSRSQFWRRLLKALDIPDELESRAARVLDLLNRRLLKADPRLQEIAETLSGATRIAARDREGGLRLRMVPQQMSDLLSRAEVILRNDSDSPWLPLLRQGQGIQSLSMIFLFHAFVDHLVQELYEQDSEPVLALEEPETHLHPHAARTLWAHVQALPGQKIITTHSPYFVQYVPFRNLRLVRLRQDGTQVASLPATFSASIPVLDGLDDVVGQSAGRLTHERASQTLTVRGRLDEEAYRVLLRCCGRHKERATLERALTILRDQSLLHVNDDELQSLETYARRMRGEIFFAERWLIVEGQADYLIVHAMAHAMDYDLDSHGVSVIDAQNNGNPATFAVLARALGIPWLAVFDGDNEGTGYVQSIEKRGFSPEELAKRCRTHGAGDLEAQLLTDGLRPEVHKILTELGVGDADGLPNAKLLEQMRRRKMKTNSAALLADRLRGNSDLALRAPPAFRAAIEQLRELK